MTEYYTSAVVMERLPKGDLDEAIILYTKDLGKIVARATGVKHIHSKLSGHLKVGGLIKARIVKKNNYRLVDALSEGSGVSAELIRFLGFIHKMTPYETQDLHLWSGIEYVISNNLMSDAAGQMQQKIYSRFLEILGFGPKFAVCNNCDGKNVSYFKPSDVIFLCSDSYNKLAINDAEVVQIR